MYKDLKNSPFYRSSDTYNRTSSGRPNPYYGGENSKIDLEVRYGFKPNKSKSEYIFENSAYDFASLENFDSLENKAYDFDSLEDKEYEYKSKQRKPVKARSITLKDYDDEHFFKHEEECEVCDYIEIFQNMDRQKFSEMFVFSEVIGKPKALKRR